MNYLCTIALLMFGLPNLAIGQLKTDNPNSALNTYLIEREIPGAGSLTPNQLKGISQQSCTVIKVIGPQIEWLHSYVADDKVYCIYKAANKEIIREHAEKGGFPANKISLLSTRISPATAEIE